jgi:superkiller protein 3
VVFGDAPFSFRLVDLLIHAGNALLLWWVLKLLLCGPRPAGESEDLTALLPWSLALLWALHPVLVTVWAADMGRTHLLSGMFALLALGVHVRGLHAPRFPISHDYLAAALLVLAMLCKPIPGWILLVVVLEAAFRGWPSVPKSPRVWLTALICVAFASVTIYTSRYAGLTEDAAAGLFGDPIARSAVAVWIYFRDIIAPGNTSIWHLPDPRTGWSYPIVWAGLAIALLSAVHAIWAWRDRRGRAASIGWAWFWGLLLPVIGVVGAREAAATDRYLYQPLMGLALVVGATVQLVLGRPGEAKRRLVRGSLTAAGVIAAVGMFLFDLALAPILRSTIQRAERTEAMNPGDPRALEGLAAAYNFSRNHPLPADDAPQLSPDVSVEQHFREKMIEALDQAAGIDHPARFYPGSGKLASSRRRLSYAFYQAAAYEESYAHADIAVELEPGNFTGWKRLAHAARALRRPQEALEAFRNAEHLVPDDPAARAQYLTEVGDLLLEDLRQPEAALGLFVAALKTGHAPLAAEIGVAACEVRAGQGARGLEIAMSVLERDPSNHRAQHIVGEFLLKSGQLEDALAWYRTMLTADPTEYRALRGFLEACTQLRRWREAILAWDDALHREPGRREFASFLVWTLALAGDAGVQASAERLLTLDPNNPLACLSRMLMLVRTGDAAGAIEWIDRATEGTPIPEAREFDRAAAAIQILRNRDEAPSNAAIAQAAVYIRGFPPAAREQARALLEPFLLPEAPDEDRAVAEALMREISDQNTDG